MKKDLDALRDRVLAIWEYKCLSTKHMAQDVGISLGTFDRFMRGNNKITMPTYMKILGWVKEMEEV